MSIAILLSCVLLIVPASSSTYSIDKGGIAGLHERSIREALTLRHREPPVPRRLGDLAARSPLNAEWEAFVQAVGRSDPFYARGCKPSFAAELETALHRGALAKRRAAGSSSCLLQLVGWVSAGVAEPDKLPCPPTTRRESMAYQTVFGSVGLHPLGPCRTAAQVWHASPLPLVVAKDAGGVDTRFALISNRQHITMLVGTAAKALLASLLAPGVVEAARNLGNAFHILGDSYSASHVERVISSDMLRHGKTAPGRFSHEACVAAGSGVGTAQFFSMDSAKWTQHFAADVDAKATKAGAALFTCLRYAIEKLTARWMKAMAVMLSPATALMRRRNAEDPESESFRRRHAATNSFIGDAVGILCDAFAMRDPTKLGDAAGGISAKYSKFSRKYRTLGIIPRSVKVGVHPALMAEDDARPRLQGLHQDALAFRRRQEGTSPFASQVPMGLWVPPRRWDLCSGDARALALTLDEFAAAETNAVRAAEERTRAMDTYLERSTPLGKQPWPIMSVHVDAIGGGEEAVDAAERRFDDLEKSLSELEGKRLGSAAQMDENAH